ncbi:transposase-like zinc-binding domain-containing protein [Algoriphagus namhaensis]
MQEIECPKCNSQKLIKSGIISGRQRYKCKDCMYHFSVNKLGKSIDKYYVVKALQLYLEGISLREIERILGVSHVSVLNWVKEYGVKAPDKPHHRPSYKVYNHEELVRFISSDRQIKGTGMVITEIGEKYLVIQWENLK